LADKVLLEQALGPVAVQARLDQQCIGLRHSGAAGRYLGISLAGVNARKYLALLHAIAGIDEDLLHRARKLRSDRGLPHGLDDCIGRVDLVDVAQADFDRRRRSTGRGGGQIRRARAGSSKAQHRPRDCAAEQYWTDSHFVLVRLTTLRGRAGMTRNLIGKV
jgi:hypothetical protein